MIVSMNADELDANPRAWRKQHNTPAKVAAAHRRVPLQGGAESRHWTLRLN